MQTCHSYKQSLRCFIGDYYYLNPEQVIRQSCTSLLLHKYGLCAHQTGVKKRSKYILNILPSALTFLQTFSRSQLTFSTRVRWPGRFIGY